MLVNATPFTWRGRFPRSLGDVCKVSLCQQPTRCQGCAHPFLSLWQVRIFRFERFFCTILYHLTCIVDHMKGVRRWLGTDSHAREILLQNISVTDIICRGSCRHWKGIFPFTFTTTSKRHIWVDKLPKNRTPLPMKNECVPDLNWKCFFLLEPPPPPTLWMWSCQLSIGPSPSPGASPQSLDPPALACGSHGSCTPVAFYRRFLQLCFHLVTFSSGKRRFL